MTTQITAALAQLNSATQREYSISSDGDHYSLIIPTGGSYPPVEAGAMVARLVQLRIAAEGRAAVRRQASPQHA